MITDALFPQLQSASFGVCAVALDQKIVFWNHSAERILGFVSRDVVGRSCDDVLRGSASCSLTPECVESCSSMRYLRSGLIPPPTQARMLTASGLRKWVSINPAVVSSPHEGGPFLLYLFEEMGEAADSRSVCDSKPVLDDNEATDIGAEHPDLTAVSGDAAVLSRRELEILRLVAQGWDTARIAVQLAISTHTVRNHIRNLRHKLSASTKLEAVVKGLSMGILSMERSDLHP